MYDGGKLEIPSSSKSLLCITFYSSPFHKTRERDRLMEPLSLISLAPDHPPAARPAAAPEGFTPIYKHPPVPEPERHNMRVISSTASSRHAKEQSAAERVGSPPHSAEQKRRGCLPARRLAAHSPLCSEALWMPTYQAPDSDRVGNPPSRTARVHHGCLPTRQFYRDHVGNPLHPAMRCGLPARLPGGCVTSTGVDSGVAAPRCSSSASGPERRGRARRPSHPTARDEPRPAPPDMTAARPPSPGCRLAQGAFIFRRKRITQCGRRGGAVATVTGCRSARRGLDRAMPRAASPALHSTLTLLFRFERMSCA